MMRLCTIPTYLPTTSIQYNMRGKLNFYKEKNLLDSELFRYLFWLLYLNETNAKKHIKEDPCE